MVPLDTWLLFCVACAALAATPGPNLLYLVSRTLCQGRAAGFVSLAGTTTGFAFHVLAAALGLSALFVAVPVAYDVVRWAGAAYLALARVADVGARRTAVRSRGRRRRRRRRASPLPQRHAHEHSQSQGRAVPSRALSRSSSTPRAAACSAQASCSAATQLVIVSAFDTMFVLAARRRARAGSPRGRLWARGRSGCWRAVFAGARRCGSRWMTRRVMPAGAMPGLREAHARRARLGRLVHRGARSSPRRCRRRPRRCGAMWSRPSRSSRCRSRWSAACRA